MPQNIYDDPDFFAGYKHLRDTASGLNEVLEQPALRALLPALTGLTVLELGCGMGQFAHWCIAQGAARVIGVDVSAKMLQVARQDNAHPQIEYVQAAIEDLQQPHAYFDVVVSSLALHYVEDYARVAQQVQEWLKLGGRFVFSVEHPTFTASRNFQGWIKDAQGHTVGWAVDNYGEEGERSRKWFVDGVVKYHRTFATYINTLVSAGLQIEHVAEPEAVPEALAARPELADERRCPPFLLIKAIKLPL